VKLWTIVNDFMTRSGGRLCHCVPNRRSTIRPAAMFPLVKAYHDDTIEQTFDNVDA
jgi:hypothetical protein